MFFLMMIIMFFCGGMCAATSPCGGMCAAVSDGAPMTDERRADEVFAKKPMSSQRDMLVLALRKKSPTCSIVFDADSPQNPAIIRYLLLKTTVTEDIAILIDRGWRERIKDVAIGFILAAPSGNLEFPEGAYNLEKLFEDMSEKTDLLREAITAENTDQKTEAALYVSAVSDWASIKKILFIALAAYDKRDYFNALRAELVMQEEEGESVPFSPNLPI